MRGARQIPFWGDQESYPEEDREARPSKAVSSQFPATSFLREATPNEVKSAIAGYGAADKQQVQRMVQIVLGMASLPTPDDAADALAIAVCIANGMGQTGRSTGSTASVMDRSAINPITRGSTPYETAVREALAREKPPVARASARGPRPTRQPAR